MFTGRRWRLVATAAVVALAPAVVAGVALALPSGQSPIQQANVKMYQAGTNRFDMALTFASGGKQFMITARGAVDLRHARAAVTVNLGAVLASLGVKVGDQAVPSNIDAVLTGKVLYIHMPTLAKQYPGKEWIKVDPKTLPKSSTQGVDIGSIVSSLNPQQVIAVLAASQSVHTLGSQTLNGTPMTRYRVVIDAAKLADAAPASQRAQIRQLMAQLGIRTITGDAWIDKSGYLRRVVSVPVALKTSTTAAAVTLKLTMGFSAFGAPINVVAPPASKTLDAAKLLGQNGAGTTSYQCTGAATTLFDNGNVYAVQNGGTSPTFSTNGAAYCLVSVKTYHWNDAHGTSAPGRVGLKVSQGLGGAGNTLGPWQATGSPGQGGVPNAYWTAVPAGAQPVVLNGTYSCVDSNPATWAQNGSSGGHGFCAVTVRRAVPST